MTVYTRLTRAQARNALASAKWPTYMTNLMIAVGAAESGLNVEIKGPPNLDGTQDLGWLQVNSRYTRAGGGSFDYDRLLSDAVYNATCARVIFMNQGLGAWAAYNSGAHIKFLPPHEGGPPLAQGAAAWFIVADMQQALNAAGASPQLTVDGAFGPLTDKAVYAWQKAHPPIVDGVARNADTIRLVP